MAYVNVSLPKKKSGGSPAAPKPKNPTIIIVDVDDIDTFPDRDDKNVLIVGNITLKAGKTALGIYAIPPSISRTDPSDGEPAQQNVGFIETVAFDHPDSYLEFDEFVQAYIGRDVIIISQECQDNKGTRVHGHPCNPLNLTYAPQDNNEGVKSTLTFATTLRSRFKTAHYRGTIPALAAAAPEGSDAGGGI